MKTSAMSAKHFHNEEAAFAYVEKWVWPKGPVCPHCGGVERIGKLKGKSTRIGLHKCYQCRQPFTVKVGTVFESSHVPLRLWLQAIYLIASSKKGISSNQLHRTLGVTLKTAWFMAHRIREAMRSDFLAPFGSGGGVVEADETFIGTKEDAVSHGAYHHKMAVLSLIDRKSGNARSFVVKGVSARYIMPVVQHNLSHEAFLMTDEARVYQRFGWRFSGHATVKHLAGEYVSRENRELHTNTVEGYFSIFKRGMRGIYQWCREKHLHRYLAEYDFRYSHRAALGFDDRARAEVLLQGVVGRRLTYRACGKA